MISFKPVKYLAVALLSTSLVSGEINGVRNQTKTYSDDTKGCDQEIHSGLTWTTFCHQQGLMCQSSPNLLKCVCYSYPNCEQLCPALADEIGMDSFDKCYNSAIGDTCVVSCKDGFKLKDGTMSVKMTCQEGGKWDKDPKCYAKCRDLTTNKGMRLSGDCRSSLCTVSCEMGYYLTDGNERVNSDSITTTCRANGEWDRQLQCIAKVNRRLAKDCAEHYKSGEKISGVYSISPLGFDQPINVYCDMTTDGGGWTVFQRRGDYGNPEGYFYRTWDEYKEGFGDLTREFWLGNKYISDMTQRGGNFLRIDLMAINGERKYATYKLFQLNKEESQFSLSVAGFTGDAGDSFTYFNNRIFTTKDHGVEITGSNPHKGGWWCCNGYWSNLNGLNVKGEKADKGKGQGIFWYSYKSHYYSMYSEMKIRPHWF